MHRRTALALGAGAVLLLGVLLVRPGTAATDADLAPAAQEASRPAPSLADLADDAVFGIALGDETARLSASGYRLGTPVAGCTPVVPGSSTAGPGPGFTAWAVDGRVASLALDGSTRSPAALTGLLGRDLGELLATPGASPDVSLVQVPWSEEPVGVGLVVLHGDGVRVLAADVRRDGLTDHVELSTPAGDACDAALHGTVTPGPPLGFDGWGPVAVGTDGTTWGEQVLVSPADGEVLRVEPGTDDVLRRCRTLLVHEPPGPVSILLVDGLVRSVSIDAGSTAAGLRVGDDAAAVTRAYPDITTAYVESRWAQGLAVAWQYPEGELHIYGGPRRAPVPGLDAEVDGPGPVVVRVEAGGSC